MTKYNLTLSLVVLFSFGFFSQSSHAVNYHELTLYGYETSDPQEYEFENESSLTDGRIFRTSLEAAYGFNQHLEVAAYLDFERSQYSELDMTAFRARLIKSFFKRNELPLNFALYIEAELPQFSDEAYALDTQLIIEKSFGPVDIIFTPGMEFVRLKEKDADGKYTETEKHLAVGFKYHLNDRFTPGLSHFTDLNDEISYVTLAELKYEARHGLSFGAGFGENQDRESILKTSIEFEIQ